MTGPAIETSPVAVKSDAEIELDRLRALPRSEATQRVLDLVQKKGGLLDDVRGLVSHSSPDIAAIEFDINTLLAALSDAEMMEDAERTRRDLGLLSNRLGTAKQNIENIRRLLTDTAKVVRDFGTEAKSTLARAQEIGYTVQ